MLLHKWFGFALVASSLILALACGGGGKSSSSAAGTTSTINGVLDFESGLSKPMEASSLSGNVTLVNMDTYQQTIVNILSNSTFIANVVPGDYKIQALRNDQKALRAYLRASSGNSNDVAVDLDSSTTATYIDLFGNSDLKNLDTAKQITRDGRAILLASSGYDDAQRTAALLVESIKLQLQQETSADNILNLRYTSTSVKSQSSNVLTRMATGANVVTLASGNVITNSTQAQNYNVNTINTGLLSNLSTAATHEKMIVSATDYTSFSLSSIEVSAPSNIVLNAKTFSTSDIAVVGNGRQVYALGRYFADFLDKFDADNLGVSLYSAPYSTLSSSETKSMNPQTIIFQSPSRALITRYQTGIQWIVNPRATSSSSFFTQAVDLSHYAEGSDGNPEFGAGIYNDGKYFILAQRLTNYLPSSNAYVVVLNGSDATEIKTGKAASGSNLMGIELPARNPQSITYSANTGLLYVTCVGQYGLTWSSSPRQFTGGIVTINPLTFETRLLIDDDNSNESTTTLTGGGLYGGLFNDLAIVSATKGYVIVYSAWGASSVRSINPTTGAVGSVISGFDSVDAKQLVLDSQKRLWILVGSEIKILNTSTDTVVSTVSGFTLPPVSLTHILY